MAEYKPLTKEERETHAAFCERQLRVRIGNSEEAILHDMAHLSLRYEATVQDRDDRIAALEADNARLRPLAEVGEFAVDERRAYKRYMAGEYGDWLQKCGVARRGVWDTADAILAQEDDGE